MILPNQGVEPRLGVLMNPYTATRFAAWQLFVSEPFNNTIAVVNLKVVGIAPNQVFGPGHVRLGILPKSRKWHQVVEQLRLGVAAIAASAADAAEAKLQGASHDPAFS
jgi:hypothetical protein